jgi:hypothetical protein
MRKAVVFLFLFTLITGAEAKAASADAREIARLNNCIPKKIDVYQQTLGNEANTIYRVECNLPKTADEKASPSASAVLIQCAGSLCEFLRPLSLENK